MATAGIAIAQSVLKIGFSALTMHSARLAGAKTENAAIPQVVSAFDADISEIVSAYNTGVATDQQVMQALVSVDNDITNYLKSGIVSNGKFRPGTMWDATTGFAGKCNKNCTAGCCVYYGDLGPVLSLIAVAVSGQPIHSQWGTNDPRWKGSVGNATIQVPKVFSSKYGGVDREGYTIVLKKPTVVSNPGSIINSTLSKILPSSVVPTTNPLQNLISPSSSSSSGYAQSYQSSVEPTPVYATSPVSTSGLNINNPLVLFGGFFLVLLLSLLAIGRR
jgi:hypothetical protein